MKSEIADYKAAIKVTKDPTAAAILVLAERVNKLGYDTNGQDQGVMEYMASRLDHLVAAVRGVASSVDDSAL